MNNWISVKYSLPGENERVLVAYEDGICSAKLMFDIWQSDPLGSYAGDGCIFHVTHWMPLPDLPIDQEDVIADLHRQMIENMIKWMNGKIYKVDS